MTQRTTHDQPQQLADLELDFLLVADGAHAVNGKLYVLGGGWTHLWLPQFPASPALPFSIAIGIKVPWNQTNRKFAWRVDVLDADNQRIADEPVAWGEFEHGRPPGLRPGSDQRVVFAIPIGVEFPQAGAYVIAITIADNELGRVTIDVNQAPAMAPPPTAPPS